MSNFLFSANTGLRSKYRLFLDATNITQQCLRVPTGHPTYVVMVNWVQGDSLLESKHVHSERISKWLWICE